MIRRLLYTTALVALSSASALAQPTYSDVFFFGTSELDTGNWIFNPTLSSHSFAPTGERGYYEGRWRSGPSWSDYFAALLGHDAKASLDGGQNFAYGIGWLGPLPGEPAPAAGTIAAIPDLYFGTQVDSALARYGNTLPSDALYVVAIGSNDLSFFGRTVEEADDVANLAVSHIQRLFDAGARNFLVQTMGGQTPYVLAYNETLLNGLRAINGLQLSVVDLRTFNQTVALAPGFLASLGITDFNTCVSDAACKNAAIDKTSNGEAYYGSTHFYFDDVHRDTKIDEALAKYALTQLPYTVPEPGTISLLAMGLIGAGALRLKRR